MPRGFDDGSIYQLKDGRWCARKRYTFKGQQRQKKRISDKETQAVRNLRAFSAEIDRELNGDTVDREHTFKDLVALAKKRELKSAEYSGETKVAGLRSWRTVGGQLKRLEDRFARMLVSEITYDDISDYKRDRLNSPIVIKHRVRTASGSDRFVEETRRRSIASVNRELALLRRLFFIAVREQWIRVHPFHRGRPLIQTSAEVSRSRILSFAEEERLLAACDTHKRRHLRLQLIFAIETGMRQNEQLTLKLSDIDFDERIITLRAYNSKTAKMRIIPIFDRLARELAASMVTRRSAKPGDLLFSDGCPRKAFEGARDAAGIDGLRWHDLRHTAITRMLHTYGLQSAEVMKISGHDNLKTFLRYVNIDREVASSIRQRVDAARAAADAAILSPDQIPATAMYDAGEVTEVPQ